jgi:MFS family permease
VSGAAVARSTGAATGSVLGRSDGAGGGEHAAAGGAARPAIGRAAGDAPDVVARTAAAAGASAVALGSTVALGPLAEPLAARAGSAAPLALPVALGLALVAGVLTGPLAQRHGHRPLLLAATPLLVTGLLGLGYSAGWIALLAAAAVGLGAGCVLVPMLVAIGTVGGPRAPLALAITSAGGAVGSAVLPPSAVLVVERIGLLGGLTALAAGSAVVLLGSAATRVPPRSVSGAGPSGPRPMVIDQIRTARQDGLGPAAARGRFGAWRDRAGRGGRAAGFGRLYLGSVASSCAVFLPLGHLAPYAAEHGLGLPFAAAMISTMSLVGLLGRVLAGLLAARIGAEAGLQGGALGLVAGLGLWWAAGPHPELVTAFAVVFGLAHGCYVALLPAVVSARYRADGLGARLGVLYTAAALGGLLGPFAAAAVTAGLGTTGPAIALGALAGVAGWLLLLGARGPARPSADRRTSR